MFLFFLFSQNISLLLALLLLLLLILNKTPKLLMQESMASFFPSSSPSSSDDECIGSGWQHWSPWLDVPSDDELGVQRGSIEDVSIHRGSGMEAVSVFASAASLPGKFIFLFFCDQVT